MAKNFLDLPGLSSFLNKLKTIFATPDAVKKVEDDTNKYVLDVDYSEISFATDEIVLEEDE